MGGAVFTCGKHAGTSELTHAPVLSYSVAFVVEPPPPLADVVLFGCLWY